MIKGSYRRLPLLLSLFGALTVAMGSCALDDRDFSLPTGAAGDLTGPDNGADAMAPAGSANGGGGTENPTGGEGPDLGLSLSGNGAIAGALGAACDEGADCDLGHCVDGVCCDSACTELCAACNVAGSEGICSSVSSDPVCPQVACQEESTECLPAGDGLSAGNCEGVGACRVSVDCATAPASAGTACQGVQGTCDGAGACVVPDKLILGAACQADDECAEGHCVAIDDGSRVCCSAACDGVCQACGSDGRCSQTPSTDARCDAVECPADNVCRDYEEAITTQLCRAFGQCRGPLDCLAAEHFTALHPDAQCACDPATGECALTIGASCESNAECASGFCLATASEGSVCCSGGCGTGLFCSSSGAGCVECEGSAVTCSGDTQQRCVDGVVQSVSCPNGCTPGQGCNALPPVGRPCSGGQCSAPGVCQADVGGQLRCCVRDCASEGRVCSAAGSCDCPAGQASGSDECLLQDGDPCQRNDQCQAASSCVDGVCCQEACDGYCERCQAGTGLCVAMPRGQQEADPETPCTNGFEWHRAAGFLPRSPGAVLQQRGRVPLRRL